MTVGRDSRVDVSVHAYSPDIYFVVPETVTDIRSSLASFPAVGDKAKLASRLAPMGNVLKDAQEVAYQTSRSIVVANRPRIGQLALTASSRRQLQRTYQEQVNRHSENLSRALDDLGVTAVSLVAESLGGVHALAATRSQTLPVERLGLWDGVGWFNTTVRQGSPYYFRYILGGEQSAYVAAHPEASGSGPEWYHPRKLQQMVGAAQMAGRQARDIASHVGLLTSDVSLQNAKYVRDELPSVAALVAFPESSFTIPPALADKPNVLADLRLQPQAHRMAEWIIDSVQPASHETINNIDNRIAFSRQVMDLRTNS